MKHFLFKDREGQTPLPLELLKGLKPKHIQTIGELDEYEEKNIADGLVWLENCNEDCGSYNFWNKLHKKLFGDVWVWAGTVRNHEINNPYFLAPYEIWPAFKSLEDDLKFWLKNKTIPFFEIAARFHEKIETIHPYANGNGRFGRILVEYFCKQHQQQIPTWGIKFKNEPKIRRKTYIAALDHARKTVLYDELIEFMFS